MVVDCICRVLMLRVHQSGGSDYRHNYAPIFTLLFLIGRKGTDSINILASLENIINAIQS